MADFTTTITDAGVLDADEVTMFGNQLILSATPELTIDGAVSVSETAPVKIFQFAKYTSLTAQTSVLTDGEDLASEALADTAVTLTPGEYGNVVTLAELADLQSGLKAGLAAATLVGSNAGTSLDKIGITAAEAFTTTVIYPNSATAASNLATTDNLDRLFANRLYNKLARTNVPTMGGRYIGIAHDDCLHDLRQDTSTGGWLDVGKYANPDNVLANEVGMFGGIRWLRSSNVTVTANSNGTIDSYKVNVFGFNAFGRGVSRPLKLVVTSTDKLNRFVNFGWKWFGAYGTIDTSNMVQGIVASSVGSN